MPGVGKRTTDFCPFSRRSRTLTASGDGHLSASAPWDYSLLGPVEGKIRVRRLDGSQAHHELSQEHTPCHQLSPHRYPHKCRPLPLLAYTSTGSLGPGSKWLQKGVALASELLAAGWPSVPRRLRGAGPSSSELTSRASQQEQPWLGGGRGLGPGPGVCARGCTHWQCQGTP